MASRSRLLAAAGVIVAAVAILPVLYLAVRFAEAAPGSLGETLTDPGTLALVARTLFLTICVTAASLVFGVTLAWLTARTDLPARRMWTVLTALPLVIPPYLAGFTFLVVAGPAGALLGPASRLGAESLPVIYGFFGTWLVLTLFGYPLVLLPVRSALRGLDPALEEAAMSLGRSRADVFWRVIVPNLRPAIGSGAVLVALYCLSDIGAASLMGFESLARSIYVVYQGSLDRTPAIMLSVILAVIAAVIVGAESRARGRSALYSPHSGGRRPAPTAPLGARRWPAFGFCAFMSLLTLAVPLAAMAYTLGRIVPPDQPLRLAGAQALTILKASAAALVLAALSIRLRRRHWSAEAGLRLITVARHLVVVIAVTLPLGIIATWLVWGIRTGWLVWAVEVPNSFGRSFKSIGQTLGASGLGTLLTLLAAWPVALLAGRRPGLLSRLIDRASFSGYALPGLVVALSLTLFGARFLPAMHQTMMMLALAYAILFLPQAAGALRVVLLQLSPRLEEAARSLGAGPLRILGRIVAPLAFPGIAAGASLVFLTIMKELPATLLLSPIGFRTLATEVWTATNEGLFSRAALPALSLILLASLPLSLLLFDESRQEGARRHRLR